LSCRRGVRTGSGRTGQAFAAVDNIPSIARKAMFAEDLLGQGVAGLSLADRRGYLEHVADRRLAQLGIAPLDGSANPLTFMDLQVVLELSNFFERRVSAYQIGVTGDVSFDHDF
jgi:ribonucleoside-diphosphate reductase beta chain